MNDYIGRQFGPYQTLRQLGMGSFGAVYMAEHRYLETLVAIKILNVLIEQERHDEFSHEARLNAHLEHPHIIRVVTFDFQDQIPYLVMEYVPNGTLRMLHPKGTRVSLEQVIKYVKQIASALDYAHERHVIHRDVKPENVLLNARGELLLSDFGIAVVQRTLDTFSTQNIAGTAAYMAPEQIQGHPCPASDQYALAVMVYEWLYGEPPFSEPGVVAFGQHLYQEPPGLCARLPDLAPAVEDAVFGALAKDPAQRFATVQDFAIALEEAYFATQPISINLSRGSVLQELDDTTQPLLTIESLHTSLAVRAAVPPGPPLAITPLSVTQRNRQILLKKVRFVWIEGVLHNSLHSKVLLALGLEKQSSAVADPWQLMFQQPDTTPRPLPTGTRVTQVYDEAVGALLILGAPGAGKTTLLLELASDLLKRAEYDERHPMPVVFNLSSWAIKKQPLLVWLADELNGRYQVPSKMAQALVEADQILPLLDGLDEVAPKERSACIEAINLYRKEHGFLPLVVCSRSADYLAQTIRVHLSCAIAIQPLNTQQVNDYLAGAGEGLRGLRIALQQDRELRELTYSPLLLSLLTLTYADRSAQDVLAPLSSNARIHQVIEHYVERMLTHGNEGTNYSVQATKHWLSWLARQLHSHNQTVFYIEHMQPDWAEEPSTSEDHSRVVIGLLFALLGIVVTGPIWVGALLQLPSSSPFQHADPVLRVGFALFFTLIDSSFIGSFNALLYRPHPGKVSVTQTQQRWRQIREGISRSIINGLLLGLFIGCLPSIIAGEIDPVGILVSGLTMGSICGLVFGLIEVLLHIQPASIQPAATVTWSWINMGRNLIKFSLIGLLCAFLVGLLIAIIDLLFNGFRPDQIISDLQFGLIEARNYSLYFVLIGAILGSLIGGLSSTILDRSNTATPNQGIRRSAFLSLRIGLIGIVGIAILVSILLLLAVKTNNKGLLPFALIIVIIGPLITLVSALRVGGMAYIQHGVLRWLLWRDRVVAWNYARFLDHAAGRILLQKVGGGYMFVHRFVLEYFAELERM